MRNARQQAFETVLDARLVSTPFIAYSTPDAQASQAGIYSAILAEYPQTDDEAGTKYIEPPAIQWDAVRGFVPLNDTGKAAIAGVGGSEANINIVSALDNALRLPPHTLLFVHNAHLQWSTGSDRVAMIQGVCNLRERFKAKFRTLMLFHRDATLPLELSDVMTVEEPLPGSEELANVVTTLCDAAHESQQVPKPDAGTVAKAASALASNSLFMAEQVTAMSIKSSGLKIASVRARTIQQIKSTPGLTVWEGGETFEEIGGSENIKRFCQLIAKGNNRPNVIAFIDEIEKQFGGYGSDSSGTSQHQMAAILQEMTDTDATGFIEYGQPGTGKTKLAKALAREVDTFVLKLDLGNMKHKHVGESESRTAAVLKIIREIGQGRVLWVATSNGLVNLPGELKSRFRLGTFFFDLPGAEEREAIWRVHEARYKLTGEQLAERPADEGWTGREIEACCANAYGLKLTLLEASKFIVPISVSDHERIVQRRQEAHNRYISAAYSGTYRSPHSVEEAEQVLRSPAARAFTVRES
jgi:hypothetical protein